MWFAESPPQRHQAEGWEQRGGFGAGRLACNHQDTLFLFICVLCANLKEAPALGRIALCRCARSAEQN